NRIYVLIYLSRPRPEEEAHEQGDAGLRRTKAGSLRLHVTVKSRGGNNRKRRKSAILVQPPGIGISPVADMDVPQTIVTAALAAKSSAETPKKACWGARSEARLREIS